MRQYGENLQLRSVSHRT